MIGRKNIIDEITTNKISRQDEYSIGSMSKALNTYLILKFKIERNDDLKKELSKIIDELETTYNNNLYKIKQNDPKYISVQNEINIAEKKRNDLYKYKTSDTIKDSIKNYNLLLKNLNKQLDDVANQLKENVDDSELNDYKTKLENFDILPNEFVEYEKLRIFFEGIFELDDAELEKCRNYVFPCFMKYYNEAKAFIKKEESKYDAIISNYMKLVDRSNYNHDDPKFIKYLKYIKAKLLQANKNVVSLNTAFIDNSKKDNLNKTGVTWGPTTTQFFKSDVGKTGAINPIDRTTDNGVIKDINKNIDNGAIKDINKTIDNGVIKDFKTTKNGVINGIDDQNKLNGVNNENGISMAANPLNQNVSNEQINSTNEQPFQQTDIISQNPVQIQDDMNQNNYMGDFVDLAIKKIENAAIEEINRLKKIQQIEQNAKEKINEIKSVENVAEQSIKSKINVENAASKEINRLNQIQVVEQKAKEEIEKILHSKQNKEITNLASEIKSLFQTTDNEYINDIKTNNENSNDIINMTNKEYATDNVGTVEKKAEERIEEMLALQRGGEEISKSKTKADDKDISNLEMNKQNYETTFNEILDLKYIYSDKYDNFKKTLQNLNIENIFDNITIPTYDMFVGENSFNNNKNKNASETFDIESLLEALKTYNVDIINKYKQIKEYIGNFATLKKNKKTFQDANKEFDQNLRKKKYLFVSKLSNGDTRKLTEYSLEVSNLLNKLDEKFEDFKNNIGKYKLILEKKSTDLKPYISKYDEYQYYKTTYGSSRSEQKLKELRKDIFFRKDKIFENVNMNGNSELNEISKKLDSVVKSIEAIFETNINQINKKLKPSMYRTLDNSGSQSKYENVWDQYLQNINNDDIIIEEAKDKFFRSVVSNNLDPKAVLKLTRDDIIIYIIVSFVIRQISLAIVETLIDKSIITNLFYSLISYLIIYTVIVVCLIVVINVDNYKLRIVLNFFNMHNNKPGITSHVFMVIGFSFLIYTLVYYMNPEIHRLEQKTLSEIEKLNLMYKIELTTIAVFTFIAITDLLMNS